MKIQLTHEVFHQRPSTERKRQAGPLFDHGEDVLLSVGVPPALLPIHRNLQITAFPYREAVDYPGHFEVQEVPVVRLEDDFARVSVLPSMGGRVLEFFDKKLNRQLLWSPPSLRLANFGLSGPWTIGGIEFNAFRFGHNVHGISSLQTSLVTLENGQQGIEMEAFDELFGSSWKVVLTLIEGTLASRMTIQNHTASDQPCRYWWTCIAVPQQWRDRVMLAPGDFLHHSLFRQGYEFDQWPTVHGVDWSQWLHQHEVISGYLTHSKSDFMGYSNEREGWSFVHRADREICRGRKLWSLGSQGVHNAWWQSLAEPNWVPYAELQCGLLPVQTDVGILHAQESISWTETFAAVPCVPGESAYAEKFAAFERCGLEKSGTSWEDLSAAAFWTIRSSQPLVEADARLALSKKIVLTGTLSDAEIEQATEAGWVGGECWIRLLTQKEASISPAAKLALAAALIHAGDFSSARGRLEGLTKSGGEIGAYAHHLLGLIAARAGALDEARRHLADSVSGSYADIRLLVTADQTLSGLGLHEERRALWQNAPPEARATDDCRQTQAALAFLDGDWATVRSILAAPALSIREGGTSRWFLYKESFFGEFAERCAAGDPKAALDLLAKGSEVAPQFNVGRQEDHQNVDFLFYRYQLSKQQGWSYMAAALANMILLESAYPGSAEALYVYRVARAENDPTAAVRRQAIEAWNAGATDAALRKLLPLRWALCRQLLHGSLEGWQALEADPLYRYRARFELRQGI